MPGRKNKQFAQVVGLDQFFVGDESGEAELIGTQSVCGGVGPQLLPLGIGELAGKNELVLRAGVRRQLGEGLDQAGQVFALISPTRVENKGAVDAPFFEAFFCLFCAQVQGAEVGFAGGRDIDHLLGREGQMLDGFSFGRVGNREEDVGLFQLLNFLSVKRSIGGVTVQVFLGVQQRDEVVHRDSHQCMVGSFGRVGKGFVGKALEQTRDVNGIRLKAAEKMIAYLGCDAFSGCRVCRRSGFCGGRMPDANLMGR